MQWLTQPHPILSYKWLSILYAIMCASALGLLAMEHWALLGEEASSVVAGFWIIPAPALPFLIHSLIMLAIQPAPAGEGLSVGTAPEEPKKDR
ncbi:hypothetical protein FNF27_00941 [Cafeteria roenbergensis]|uniref:Uncharacterized protein n=1 Tax=Cafeteria roenbergensis TaxID=33653 RepID=A0A5A8E0D7_CAFRO|nr:hypothetical protein FNF29_01185 [Cafeteria roenbergensis]KAA0168500.1 hypothetical protein FNF31_00380 [Cafeteria roenbergensis]KAA0171215.1 hypothetical protein FNF28_00981 [Cafeteria roenbergensis]KAA0177770.1 hypothetical protein FNF27_00941 [Cafeteria roenbergensis]|mmetsp:Transcript_14754/g.55615  ORF Transcript_14754/g.55615 Transcript_14754/m.55615 type:complete len:93 (-) Transcript_14754:103-381(-)|eukprot:KAA0156393.1 hypothetical protein FNF29_01185 [Cafeteria roenbergensis]